MRIRRELFGGRILREQVRSRRGIRRQRERGYVGKGRGGARLGKSQRGRLSCRQLDLVRIDRWVRSRRLLHNELRRRRGLCRRLFLVVRGWWLRAVGIPSSICSPLGWKPSRSRPGEALENRRPPGRSAQLVLGLIR